MIVNLDCRIAMRGFGNDSFDSIVTDPPYELGFMAKSWDSKGIAYDVSMWREALRILKPGAYMVAFGGSRTYHRMTCAIEDAGFEIRDCIMWLYGSGFPKSLNVSKAIDASLGLERAVTRPGTVQRDGYGEDWDTGDSKTRERRDAPASLEASAWQGWGTALKPAHEPIILARKPLNGTVAANVATFGVGGLNIDGCRVGTDNGRWPANVIHDGSDEVTARFPFSKDGVAGKRSGVGGTVMQTGMGATDEWGGYGGGGSAARFFYCAKASRADRDQGLQDFALRVADTGHKVPRAELDDPRRNNIPRLNYHPTVKPTELMRYLCRLITPAGGTIVDPFAGSGSTGKAAALEGFQFIGFETDADYAALAQARINAARVSHA